MTRIYLPLKAVKEQTIFITGEKAHYLISVLRCRAGDKVMIFDGNGNCYKTEITGIDKKSITAEVREKVTWDPEPPVRVLLIQGLLKGEKMDLVMQKATELGVHEILPVVTERSQIRETRKISRWRKIVEEASRQSGRNSIPRIQDPLPYSQAIEKTSFSGKAAGIIFYEEGGIRISMALSLSSPSLSDISILIGPEGGFTREEVACAQQKGFTVASLGKRILRAETAAIAALSIVQYHFGGMD
jgi:16S rRNA (uracil1498-N3)-methyltransferase